MVKYRIVIQPLLEIPLLEIYKVHTYHNEALQHKRMNADPYLH